MFHSIHCYIFNIIRINVFLFFRTNIISTDFKVIRREFLLSANYKSIDKRLSNEKSASTFQVFDADGSSTVLDNDSKSTETNKHITQCGIVADSLRPENASPDPLSASKSVMNTPYMETPKSYV